MENLPVVYSCSGCSTAGQMANALALRLDREGLAEMSCIAGVGGGVEPLVHKAQKTATVLAIDGCPLRCALHCLRRAGVEPSAHFELTQKGVRKEYHWEYDPAQADEVFVQMLLEWDKVLALKERFRD